MFPVTVPSREIRTVRSLVASVRLASTVVPPAAAAACTPGSVATGVSPAGPYRQTPDLGGLRGPGEQHVVAVGADNRLYLQSLRGYRGGRGEFGRRCDDQAPRVAADPGPYDVTVCQLGGHAVDDVRPTAGRCPRGPRRR